MMADKILFYSSNEEWIKRFKKYAFPTPSFEISIVDFEWLNTQKKLPEQLNPSKSILICFSSVHVSISDDEILKLVNDYGFFHIIQSFVDENIFKELEMTLKMLFEPTSYLEGNVTHLLNEPIVHQYEFTFSKAKQKQGILEQLKDIVQKLPRSSSVRESILTQANEMIMNAVFSAPRDLQLRNMNQLAPRNSDVTFERDKVATLSLLVGDSHLLLTCDDPFGTFPVLTVMGKIRDCSRRGVSQAINYGLGGAGIGSYIIFQKSKSFLVLVDPGVRTLLCSKLPLGLSAIDLETESKNIHIVERPAVKLEKIKFQPNELLFKEGDKGDFFYLIESGIVDVLISNETHDSEIHVGTIGIGEALGELSIITKKPRNATARAKSEVLATKITEIEYHLMSQVLPPWSISFIKGLAQRIQTTDSRLSHEYFKALESAIENARMGKELQIAHTVQETLFPSNSSFFGDLEIAGYYESASECSGDWWHTCENGDRVFLWIGDATGHGVSAALITSAARAVASVLEHQKDLTPAFALNVLNRAIYDTSKGKIMMTFFLASYNKVTHEFSYCSASHEAPYLFKMKDGIYQRDLLLLLDQVNNPRLGENSDYSFTETTIQLDPQDLILAYTDGVTGLVNLKGRPWGEKNLLQAVFNKMNQSTLEMREMIHSIKESMSRFQDRAKLIDDITFFIIRRN